LQAYFSFGEEEKKKTEGMRDYEWTNKARKSLFTITAVNEKFLKYFIHFLILLGGQKYSSIIKKSASFIFQ